MDFNSKDIAIITFYAAQRTELKRVVHSYKDIQVLSVDQSQGREYELVFISTVRTSPGRFISDY
jgi:superfamily I DNA and/or RNA helicase